MPQRFLYIGGESDRFIISIHADEYIIRIPMKSKRNLDQMPKIICTTDSYQALAVVVYLGIQQDLLKFLKRHIPLYIYAYLNQLTIPRAPHCITRLDVIVASIQHTIWFQTMTATQRRVLDRPSRYLLARSYRTMYKRYEEPIAGIHKRLHYIPNTRGGVASFSGCIEHRL
jgi:hypothetical protein